MLLFFVTTWVFCRPISCHSNWLLLHTIGFYMQTLTTSFRHETIKSLAHTHTTKKISDQDFIKWDLDTFPFCKRFGNHYCLLVKRHRTFTIWKFLKLEYSKVIKLFLLHNNCNLVHQIRNKTIELGCFLLPLSSFLACRTQ